MIGQIRNDERMAGTAYLHRDVETQVSKMSTDKILAEGDTTPGQLSLERNAHLCQRERIRTFSIKL